MVLLLKSIVVLCAASMVRASPKYEELVEAGQKILIQCRKRTESFEFPDEDFQASVSRMRSCLKSALVDSLDDLVTTPEIPINDYISLVSMNNSVEEFTSRSEPDDSLLTTMTNKLYALINTHSMKLNLAAFENSEEDGQVEGRQRRIRRRFRRAFPMVVAGFFIMAAILIPPGFQFMAIVTSKALFIAKIAFMMAVAGHYRGIMADLNYHHHDLLHHPSSVGEHSHLPLHPGELPGGFGLQAGLLGAGLASNPGLTQAFALQNSPFGLGNSILPLRRS